MKTLKKTLMSAAVGAALMAGAQAHAGAIGTAYLEINDLTFYIVDTTGAKRVITVGTDIIPTPGTAGIVNNGDTNADLNGTVQDSEVGSSAPTQPWDVGGDGYSCVGTCTYVDDSFVYLTKPQDNTTTYVVADVFVKDAIVAGLPGIPVGADAKALAESAVLAPNSGSSSANTGVNAAFTFISTVNGELSFDGTFAAYLRAALLNVDGTTADATVGWEFTVRDRTDGSRFGYSLDDDDNWVVSSISTLTPGDDIEESFGGAFGSTSTGGFLVAGHEYELTLDHDVEANSEAQRVPVPAPLALLGAGLLALGGARRVQKKKA